MSRSENVLSDMGANVDYHEDRPEGEFAEFDKVVRSRRSVRRFLDEPVPAEVIERAIDHALLAPSSSNHQHAEFFWIKDPEKIDILRKACFSQPAVTTAQELLVCVARSDTWQRNNKFIVEGLEDLNFSPKSALIYYKKLMPFLYSRGPLNAMHLVRRIFFTFRGFSQPTPRSPVGDADLRILAVGSAALAAENFLLSIRAHGFDTCPIGGHDAKRVKAMLGLPKLSDIVMVIAVGRAGPGGLYGPQMRLPRELFVKTV